MFLAAHTGFSSPYLLSVKATFSLFSRAAAGLCLEKEHQSDAGCVLPRHIL